MSHSGNWPLLERLTNNEFLKLVPQLSLEHSLLTQVFIPKKKWIHMLDVNFQTLQVKCGACNKQVRFEDIKKHLTQMDHLISTRSNVKQFYHPFYTYGKGDIKLARGEHVQKEVRDNALCELNLQMKSFKKNCILAKRFANIVHQKARELEDDQLLHLILDTNIVKPEEMFVKVCLPFDDIPKLLFCVVGGEWRTAIGYKNFSKKANFHCNICGINCSGIGSLNSHLNGYTHKLRQLEILALRFEVDSKVNKNCCIQFGDSFLFSVKEEAKQFYRGKIGNESELECNNSLQHTKLSSEIVEKISALDQYAPKKFFCTDNNEDFRNDNNEVEHDGDYQSNENLGHIGVEYVLKIIKNENDRDPKFECGLCKFMGDTKKMQCHLLSYDHKKKYLDLHYPDTIKKYESAFPNMRHMELRAVISEIVDKVAIELEKHHSRSLPYTVLLNDYNVKRSDFISEIYALLHASQNRGPSFSNVLSEEELWNLKNIAAELANKKTYKSIDHIVFTRAPKAKIYLNQMSHDPVIRFREYNAKVNKIRTSRISPSLSPTRTQIYDPLRRGDSRNDRSHVRVYEHRSRSRSPITLRSRSPKRGHQVFSEAVNAFNQNIWVIYRREIATAANEIEIAYENYRKNPESHPLYEEEWNNFWQRRKKELEREGFNHRIYNFQPEWVHYFKQRIEVLFGEELHKSQINIRRKLGIPLNAEEDCQRSQPDQYMEEHCIKNRDRVAEDVVGDEFRIHKRQSPTDCRDGHPPNKRHFQEDNFVGRLESISTQQLKVEEMVVNISDNHSNVVHVLRLMTALEDHLGSLGGKVMDLLSNALQLEKNFPGNAVEFEANILTSPNCNVLETAMEKLKGILFAGLLDEKKVAGFNRVIQYTTQLLKYAEKMGWRQGILPEINTFHHGRGSTRVMQEHNAVGGAVPKSSEKPLSDTLMDLVNRDEHFPSSSEQRALPVVCPPPPTINESNLTTSVFVPYKGQRNSGLASFDTKLSLDQPTQIQKRRQNQSNQNEFGQLKRNSNSGGYNLNNNSFKNDNDTRTNINTRTNTGINSSGSNVGGNMNNNNGSAPQFRNPPFFSKAGHNNAMYQGGGGGGNRNQNWSQWNNNN